MEEGERSHRVRDTITHRSDEELLAMLAAPAGEYTSEALDYARAELKTRGGEGYVARRVQEKPDSPDEYVAEYPSDEDVLTHSYNGFGTTFYGKRDVEPDGSYVTTKWLIIAHLPIVPRGSFRLRVVKKQSGLAHSSVSYAGHEVPLNRRQVITTYLGTYGSILALLIVLAMWG